MSSIKAQVRPERAPETTRLQSASMQDHGTMERPLLSKASSSQSDASATRLDMSDVPRVERVTSSIRSLAQASERTYRLLRLRRSLVCVALYIIVTVVMYGYVLEHWGWLRALYFASVTFTSVGTGDVTPSSDAGRLFTTAYALFSICIVAVALAEIAESYRVQQAAHIRALKKTLITQLHKQHSRDVDNYVGAIQLNGLKQQRQNRQELRAVLMRALLPVVAVNVVGVTVIAAAERWTAIDAMYYAVVTSTTIGYGDIHPETTLALGVAVVYIPLAVASVASAVSQVIGYLVTRSDEERRTELLNKSFAWEAVFEMDTDHDNAVSELEYCLYMFELWGMVDKDVIRAVRRRFRELDVDGNGKLTAFDFMTDARAFKTPGTAIRRATTMIMYAKERIRQLKRLLGQVKIRQGTMVELSTFSFWIVYPLPVLFVLLSFTPREVRAEGWKVVIWVLKALGLYRSELGTTALALLVCLVAVSIVIDFFGAASSLRQALRLQRQMRITEEPNQRERLQCLRWEAETSQWLSTFVLGLWVIAFGFFLRLTEIEMLRMRMSKLQKQFTQKKHGRNAQEPEKAPTPSLDMWAMRSPKAATPPGSTTRIRRFDFEAEEKRESDTTRIAELEELVHKLQAENDGLHAKLSGLHHKIPAGKRGSDEQPTRGHSSVTTRTRYPWLL